MKILHLDRNNYPLESLQKLEQLFQVDYSGYGNDEFAKLIRNEKYYALFTKLGVHIDADFLEIQDQLKYVITPTTGLNHIDLIETDKKGITVISLKGEYEFLSSIKSTAEHTWALLLSLVKRINYYNSEVTRGKWERKDFLNFELSGKTLGIIGFGRLGKIIASFGRSFNMNVLINDLIGISNEDIHEYKSVSLDQLLSNSDVVILLIDYRPENQNFMDKKKFQLMKQQSYFINTSRGELVDEIALIDALNSGHLSGAALDVLNGDSSWAHEVPEGNTLIEYTKKNYNLIITPHVGGYGKDSVLYTRRFVTEKFLRLHNETANNR